MIQLNKLDKKNLSHCLTKILLKLSLRITKKVDQANHINILPKQAQYKPIKMIIVLGLLSQKPNKKRYKFPKRKRFKRPLLLKRQKKPCQQEGEQVLSVSLKNLKKAIDSRSWSK